MGSYSLRMVRETGTLESSKTERQSGGQLAVVRLVGCNLL